MDQRDEGHGPKPAAPATGSAETPIGRSAAPPAPTAAAREAGLRDCLRANLHRRKQQARARAVSAALTGGPGTTGETPADDG